MMEALGKIGCPFYVEKHISCEPCKTPATGYFNPSGKPINANSIAIDKNSTNTTADNNLSTEKSGPPIILCSNYLPTDTQVEETMIHELLHAYDYCRHKFDYEKDALQVACSEVRAANMSGDCRWTNEILRGFFGYKKHHQACVQRRALLSLIASPACQSDPLCRENPQAFLDKVFPACVKDYSPFVAMPY